MTRKPKYGAYLNSQGLKRGNQDQPVSLKTDMTDIVPVPNATVCAVIVTLPVVLVASLGASFVLPCTISIYIRLYTVIAVSNMAKTSVRVVFDLDYSQLDST